MIIKITIKGCFCLYYKDENLRRYRVTLFVYLYTYVCMLALKGQVHKAYYYCIENHNKERAFDFVFNTH